MPPLRLIHRDASRTALVFFQVYVFGLWLARIAVEPLERVALLPRSYYDPVGVLRLLPDPMHDWLLGAEGLMALRVALVLVCALCLWSRTFRYAAPVGAFLLLLHQSLIRGFGHINHAEILSLMAAFILAAFANLPERKWRSGYNPNAAPLITIALVMTLCYSLVGVSRIQNGVSVFTGDTIVNYVVSRSLRSYYYDFNVGMGVASWEPAVYLLRAGFPFVTLCEALAPLVLVSRRFRVVFLAVMIPFHLLTLVLMEVSFLENLLLFIVLVDYSRLLDRWRHSFARTTRAPPIAKAAA